MNRTSQYSFTIIVPLYNEAENVPALERSLSSYIAACPEKACVLFVDDGSTDGGGKLIKEACSRNEAFFYIKFDRNRGLSAALKAGIDYCDSPLCGYIDADLQTDPRDFDLLLAALGGHSLATGVRASRNDSPSKRLQSRFANAWRRMFTHDGARDTGCPLKLLRTDAAKRLPLFKGMHRFIPALVLLQEGGSFTQVEVSHRPRTAGKSKFHLWNRLAGPMADCFAYLWMKPRYINYTVESDNLS